MVACAVGELVGFGGIPILGGTVVYVLSDGLQADVRAALMFVVAVAGGLGEGAVLALFQLRVLRERLPRLEAGSWVRATALAGAFAWACGMLAPTADELIGLTATAQIAIWVPASILILLSIGSAQALVLRHLVARPGRWVVANALGWLLGLPWTFALPAALPETAPPPVRVAGFVVAGVLMGLTVGIVTGMFVVRLERIPE